MLDRFKALAADMRSAFSATILAKHADDNALFPIISWAVAERNEEKQNVAPLTL